MTPKTLSDLQGAHRDAQSFSRFSMECTVMPRIFSRRTVTRKTFLGLQGSHLDAQSFSTMFRGVRAVTPNSSRIFREEAHVMPKNGPGRPSFFFARRRSKLLQDLQGARSDAQTFPVIFSVTQKQTNLLNLQALWMHGVPNSVCAPLCRPNLFHGNEQKNVVLS